MSWKPVTLTSFTESFIVIDFSTLGGYFFVYEHNFFISVLLNKLYVKNYLIKVFRFIKLG